MSPEKKNAQREESRIIMKTKCTLDSEMQAAIGVVHANVGQKLLICYPIKSFLGDR
jgi:hypothetical protein